MVDETIGQKVDEIAEEGKDLAEKAKEGAEKAAEDGKTGFDQIGDEIGKVVETAKEVGKEIWVGSARGDRIALFPATESKQAR